MTYVRKAWNAANLTDVTVKNGFIHFSADFSQDGRFQSLCLRDVSFTMNRFARNIADDLSGWIAAHGSPPACVADRRLDFDWGRYTVTFNYPPDDHRDEAARECAQGARDRDAFLRCMRGQGYPVDRPLRDPKRSLR